MATTTPATTVAVIGSTGLVGSHMLSTLLATDHFTTVHSISRRRHPKVPEGTAKLNSIIGADTSTWASQLAGVAPDVVFSALGTTRAQAGGLDAQWKIDHGLNVELARAVHAAGTRTFVFVSSAGTDGILGWRAPYSQMKKGVEDAVRDADFDQAIILRPGALMGEREGSRSAESFFGAAIEGAARILGRGFRDSLAQDADVVARAAVKAVLLAREGKAPERYWVLGQKDIVQLGRDEWQQGQQTAPQRSAAATAETAGKKDEA